VPFFSKPALLAAPLVFALVLGSPAAVADTVKTDAARFTGEPSCASSSCHGGGTGKDQCLIWQKKDVHTNTAAILGAARSSQIARAVGVADAAKDVRCTICHNPLQGVAEVRFAPTEKGLRDQGVSCETCHGPAENWLRFHTRLDITHGQRMSAGMREMRDLYDRANVCVACHLNVDAELIGAGHPEMFFELDGQMGAQPPHWTDKENDPWEGPRAWLTGQAVDLRELSWKLAAKPTDAKLAARVKGLHWLLSESTVGAAHLREVDAGNAKGVQAAADRLAHAANHEKWSRESTEALFLKLAQTNEAFRDASVPIDDQLRRAQVLALALDRLWQALKANHAPPQKTLEEALKLVADTARVQEGFDPQRFAGVLQQVEVAIVRKE
jgi:Cytochrome c554 and c-prime